MTIITVHAIGRGSEQVRPNSDDVLQDILCVYICYASLRICEGTGKIRRFIFDVCTC